MVHADLEGCDQPGSERHLAGGKTPEGLLIDGACCNGARTAPWFTPSQIDAVTRWRSQFNGIVFYNDSHLHSPRQGLMKKLALRMFEAKPKALRSRSSQMPLPLPSASGSTLGASLNTPSRSAGRNAPDLGAKRSPSPCYG